MDLFRFNVLLRDLFPLVHVKHRLASAQLGHRPLVSQSPLSVASVPVVVDVVVDAFLVLSLHDSISHRESSIHNHFPIDRFYRSWSLDTRLATNGLVLTHSPIISVVDRQVSRSADNRVVVRIHRSYNMNQCTDLIHRLRKTYSSWMSESSFRLRKTFSLIWQESEKRKQK